MKQARTVTLFPACETGHKCDEQPPAAGTETEWCCPSHNFHAPTLLSSAARTAGPTCLASAAARSCVSRLLFCRGKQEAAAGAVDRQWQCSSAFKPAAKQAHAQRCLRLAPQSCVRPGKAAVQPPRHWSQLKADTCAQAAPLCPCTRYRGCGWPAQPHLPAARPRHTAPPCSNNKRGGPGRGSVRSVLALGVTL